MPTFSVPNAEILQVTELLAVAKAILPETRDPDLVKRVTILKEYLDFSQMNPDRDYGPVLRRAAAELSHSVESHLKSAPIR